MFLGSRMVVSRGRFSSEVAAEIPVVIDKAFKTAVSGRPGPVLIDFPKDEKSPLMLSGVGTKALLVLPILRRVVR